MENIKDTTYDFTLVLRQMHTEEILREKLASVGATYYPEAQCIDIELDESASLDSYGVTSTFTNTRTQEQFKLKRYALSPPGQSGDEIFLVGFFLL